MATKSGSGRPGRKAAAGKIPAPPTKAASTSTADKVASTTKVAAPKVAAPKVAAPKVAAPKAAAPKAAAPKVAAPKAAVPKSAPVGTAVRDDDAIEIADPETTSSDSAQESSAQQRTPWPVRLYLGEIGFDFIGKRKIWYVVSVVLILICLGSMIFRQFNLGVEFAGGERFRSPGTAEQLQDVSQAVQDLGTDVTSAQAVGDNQLVIITADLSEEQSREITDAIAGSVGVDATDVTNTTTSASWGQDVTGKALQGLIVFLVLVLVFLAVRFQWKMAVAAMAALVHDLVITAGIYSLVGFEVTPASVIGFLTILGFSLYDTVVVFDKVDENAKGLLASQRRTYSESANLAINQVLMRSINTSIFALLPVLGLLYAGVFLIGEGTLQDLALVLFVGMLTGVYSSIFLAAPILCDLKEREPEYQKLAKRLNAKRAGTALDKPVVSKRSSSGDTSVAPAVVARADRGRSKATVVETADRDGSDDDDDAVDPEDTAEGTTGRPGGGGTLVASARRTRPRSTRNGVGTTKADAVTSAATKPDSATNGKSSGQSVGSRLAPRPGAKPTREARTRGGSAKRNR